MEVGIVCSDPTTTSVGVGDQQFDVVDGMAKVPLSLAAHFLSFPHRYKVVPLPPVAQRGPARGTDTGDKADGATGATGDTEKTDGATGDTGTTGPVKANKK